MEMRYATHARRQAVTFHTLSNDLRSNEILFVFHCPTTHLNHCPFIHLVLYFTFLCCTFLVTISSVSQCPCVPDYSIIFENNHRLDFIEVKNTDTKPKIKYRYHYMNEAQVMSSVMIMHPILLKLLVFPIINTRLMTLKKALSQVLSKCF